MKVLIIMAILSAAIALNTAQSASDSAHISATYPSKLELVLPDGKELYMQDASPGKEANVSCEVLVRANVDWALKVDGEHSGYLQKGTDSKKRPQKKLKVRYTGATLLPAETTLSSGDEDFCNGPPGEVLIPTEFKQEFTWTDAPDNYQMKIYFRLSPK